MKTLIEYFLEKFWNISENRIVKVSMDAHELTNLLRTKQTKLCVSCEEIEGETLYEDLITFDEDAMVDEDDYYIAYKEKSFDIFKKLYKANKIIGINEANPIPKSLRIKSLGKTLDEAITSIPDKTYHYVSMSRTAILRIFSNFSQEENEQILSKIIERTGIQDIHVEVKTEESTNCLLELELQLY